MSSLKTKKITPLFIDGLSSSTAYRRFGICGLSKIQPQPMHLLAAERSPDSYIAGGMADSEERLEAAAEADKKILVAAGLAFTWKKIQDGKRDAIIEGLGEKAELEWVFDSAFRFFPTQRDELFGYVLHPVDLVT
jgi:hypothetical protein